MMYQPRMKQSSVGVVAAATLGAAEKKVGGLISSTWKGGASNEMLLQEDESSIDVSSPRDNNSPIFGILAAKAAKEQAEQQLQQQQARPRTKEEEKLERRRAKDDATRLRKMLEKEKELEKKAKRKSSKANKGGDVAAAPVATLSDFIQSETNYIPLFLEKCILFIEQEGLDSEGIYRVPGNRAHVDLLYQKFEEGEWGENGRKGMKNNLFSFAESTVDIEALDIPVNAVATALKDFFSKHLPPLFDDKLTTELEDIAGETED